MECEVSALGDDGIVRDHQHGLAELFHQAVDQLHDFVGAFAIEVAGGLVAKQDGGVGDDGAGDGHALFLSAGELPRIVIHALREANDAEGGFDVLAALGLGEFCEQQRQLDVLKGGEYGDEVVHLKDEADMAGAPLGEFVAGHVRDFVASHGDAAVGGDVQAAKQIEQRSLAGAAGAHEADEVAFVDVEIEALQDLDFFAAAAVSFVQSADLNQAVGFSSAIDSDHLSCSCYWRFIRLNPCQPGRSMLRPYTCYFLISTDWPSRRFAGALITTVSPTATPAMTSVLEPRVPPSVTARRSVLSSFTRKTIFLPSSSCTALWGIRMAVASAPGCFFCSAPRKVTLMPMSGRMRGSNLRKETRTFTVAFWRSADGMMVRTRLGISHSG